MPSIHRLSVLCFIALAAVACNSAGGPEGTYTVDRALSTAALQKNVEAELGKMFRKTKIPEDILKSTLEEAKTGFDQLEIELQIEKGGTFKAKSKMEGDTKLAEGTWTLTNDSLEMIETASDGKPRPSPIKNTMKFENGRLSIQDPASSPVPYLILARQ